MDFRKRFSSLLKRFRRIFIWITLCWHDVAYTGGLREWDRQDRALTAVGGHLDYLGLICTPWVHIKSRWAVRTAKRSILTILKKHRGLWRVFCRGQEWARERSNEKSGAREWKRTVRLGLGACEARTPLVAKMSRRPLASFQNRLRKKKMTILHSWHVYEEVLQKVKIKRRNLHWNRYNNKSSDNN